MTFVFHNDCLSQVSLVFSKDTVTPVAPKDEATPCLQIFIPDIQEVQNTHCFLRFRFYPSRTPSSLKASTVESFLTGDVAIKSKRYKWEV